MARKKTPSRDTRGAEHMMAGMPMVPMNKPMRPKKMSPEPMPDTAAHQPPAPKKRKR